MVTKITDTVWLDLSKVIFCEYTKNEMQIWVQDLEIPIKTKNKDFIESIDRALNEQHVLGYMHMFIEKKEVKE